MEPKKERLSAEQNLDNIDAGDKDDALPEIKVPASGDLPEPPVVNYTRPALKRGQYAATPNEHIGVSAEQDKINVAARMGSGLSAGITFASSVIVSAGIGMWLDHRFEPHSATPWATVAMTLLGFAAGIITFVRITSVADENIKRRK